MLLESPSLLNNSKKFMCLKPGDTLHARYQIIQELGRGGFATTYKAKDLDIPEDYYRVVKEIQPPDSQNPQVLQDAMEQFEKEVRTLIRLGQHDCIPKFFACFQERTCSQERENFYLILEYIEGHPLSKELTANNLWDAEQVIKFLQDILPVIEFVHQNNVIHRDIKPSNLIRRASDNQIVLIDFGAVKEISNLPCDPLERTRNIGTCGYIAAEQAQGLPRFCSDIYSVGIICLQALTGLPAKEVLEDTQNDRIWHSNPELARIARTRYRLIAILKKMVRYHFANRYRSAAQILEDLKGIKNEFPPPLKWLLLGIAGTIAGCAIALVGRTILTPESCSLVRGDSLSCGEESLLITANPRLKRNGVDEFSKSNYRVAFQYFKRSWNEEERKDPETLIYMNNALLKAQKADYYTIAVAIPVRKNAQDGEDIDLAKEILRGVAQAQTEFNLKLFNSEIERNLNGLEFQENRAIKLKGLQVIIADDANEKEQAIARANSLVKLGSVLGAIGHYTNEMTVPTVDIYDRNKLVLISPGTTTEEITERPRKFFFRTVPSTKVSVEVFTKYLMEKQGQKAVAGFYNTNTESASSLWEEFRKQFKQRGGKIAKITEFDLSKSDFNANKALQEIGQTEKTTIVLSPGHHLNALNNAMKLLKANLGKNWFVGTGGIYGQKTLETAAQLPSFEKILVAVSWNHLNSPNRKFVEDNLQLWEGNVSHRTALTYDAARTLIQAIEMQQKMQQQPSREGMQKTIVSSNFSADGATGKIEFETTGDRKNFQPKLVHIVKCNKERFGVTFVPIEFPTAAAAGLKCE
ncbi:MAG: bifunctional serine/threonine-protein kinase/ABC transporter substrate-binding protein [Oscillatoriaceae cyanobacterium Prado104]|jgi:ABC-type branched-subunit amino acid transport system substrate-binding protein|nr:bifunctional serine/threonine-protein kinase/ABC transporter substrate-binding protein [Oscillatoriaceae cyanobacterium Prado104]